MRQSYETAPVTLATDAGKVTCQLYSKDILIWDEAIAWPAAMIKAEADPYCKAEGRREKEAG